MLTPETFNWICTGPLGITICVVGIIGNIISVFIWQRVISKNRQGNPSTAFYLIILGVCDIGVLIFFILTKSISIAESYLKTTYSYDVFYAWFSFPMLSVCIVASVWLIVGVTINRWVLIAYPTQSYRIYSKNKTYLVISATLFFTVAVNIPQWFKFKVVAATNGTYMIAKTTYGVSESEFNYTMWFHCVVLVLVPWFLIAVFNALIVKKLRERTTTLTSIESKCSIYSAAFVLPSSLDSGDLE